MTGNNWWAPATSSIAPPCFKVLTREAAGGHGRGSEWSACRPLLWLRWLTKWPGRSDNSPGATVPPVQNEDIEMGEDLLCSFLPTCSATLSTFLSSRLQFLKTWDLHGFIFSLYHNFLSFISFCSVFFFLFFISSSEALHVWKPATLGLARLWAEIKPREQLNPAPTGQKKAPDAQTGSPVPAATLTDFVSGTLSSPRGISQAFANVSARSITTGICPACLPRLRRPSFWELHWQSLWRKLHSFHCCQR